MVKNSPKATSELDDILFIYYGTLTKADFIRYGRVRRYITLLIISALVMILMASLILPFVAWQSAGNKYVATTVTILIDLAILWVLPSIVAAVLWMAKNIHK